MFVGVDAGGTKTQVEALGTDLEPVLRFELPGADITAKPAAAVEAILRGVLSRLQGTGKTPSGIVLGLPGYGEAAGWTGGLEKVCGRVFGGLPYTLMNDVQLALFGAFPDGPGAVVLSGTGSMVWARDAEGRNCRVGGWGTLFGDEGSAYAVGVAALRAVGRALDGRGPATRLNGRLLAGGSLWRFYEGEESALRARVAALALEVEGAAQEGDEVALTIWQGAAEALLEHLDAAYKTLSLPADTPLACVGGTFKSGTLTQKFAELAERRGYTRRVTPAHSPSFGGALLAKRLADGLTLPH